MKNKLTSEEQAIGSKLNEAEFAFQEAHWAEMQQMIGKKGFFSNYGTFMKAAITFVVITGSVLLVNEIYPEDSATAVATEVKENSEKKEEAVVTNSSTQDLSNESLENEQQLTNEETPNDASSALPAKSPSESKKNNELSTVKKTGNKELINTKESKTELAKKPQENNSPVINKQNDAQKYYIELTEVVMNGVPCLDEKVDFIARVRGKLADGISFKWFLNGQQQTGNKITNALLLDKAGQNHLVVKAYYENEFLSETKNDFKVENKVELNFTATDNTDPFYDENVNLKATNEDSKNLVWYIDKKDKVKYGNEVVWSFSKEGRYEITLQHTSDYGCVTTVTKPVSMKKDFNPAFPKEFTPDGDGTNDVFVVEAFTLLDAKFYMQVLDLQGRVVFQTNDPQEGWNGRLNNSGDLLPYTVYAWTIEFENENGVNKVETGKVRLRKLK